MLTSTRYIQGSMPWPSEESAAEAPHPEERLLHRLLRVGGVADDEVRGAVRPPVPGDQQVRQVGGATSTSWLY